MNPPKLIPIGARFGQLIMLGYTNLPQHRYCKVQCDCGVIKIVTAAHLRRDSTRSCGHLKILHGQTDSDEFRCWSAMRNRCNNPKADDYDRYGGRGIKIAPEWDDFAQFLADLGSRPSPKHSLDRWPDNNGDYRPDNVRWATARQQCQNRRNNRPVTINGVTKCVTEWAREAGLSTPLLRWRLDNHWPENQLLTPPRAYGKVA